MLAYALAIAVGFSGLVLFSTAFFMSDIHRKDDFFWSAISLFYAIVLWFCATSFTGGVLLGQAAAVALLISYSWQTLKLRKAIAYPEKAAELNNFSILEAINGLLSRGKAKPQPVATTTTTPPTLTDREIAIPETATPETQKTVATAKETDKAKTTNQSSVATSSTSDNTLETNIENSKAGFLGKLFSGKKQPSPQSPPAVTQTDTSSVANTKLNDILDDAVVVETSKPLSSLKERTTDKSDSAKEAISETSKPSATITEEESVTASETKTTLKTDAADSATVEAEDNTATTAPSNPDETIAEKITIEEEKIAVEPETSSTLESSFTEENDRTLAETAADTPNNEISVTDTVTSIPPDGTEETVIEAVVIETSEPDTAESVSEEASETQVASNVEQFLDELDDNDNNNEDNSGKS